MVVLSHLEFLKSIENLKIDSSFSHMDVEQLTDYYVLQFVIMYWYVSVIFHDLLNIEFFELFYHFVKGILISGAFAELMISILEYLLLTADLNIFNVFILRILAYFYDLFDSY